MATTLSTITAPSHTPPASATQEEHLAALAELLLDGDEAPPGVCLRFVRGGDSVTASRGVTQAFDDHGPVVGAPMGPHTRVDVGSVTKVLVTTYAAMTLLDRGELSLELRLGSVLPEIRGLPAADASLRMLLEHRAGLWEWWPLYLRRSPLTRAWAVHAAAAIKLRYPPGHARHYSDLGFILLGEALAAVYDATFAELADALVFTALGLDESSLVTPRGGDAVAASSNGDSIEREMIASGKPYPVQGELADFDGWRTGVLVGEVNDGNAFHAFGGAAGHAGAFSTAADLASYGQHLLMCLAGDGPLRPDTVGQFLHPGADPSQGLGFRRWTLAGRDWWGHTGFPGVAFALCPAIDVTAVLVTNRLHVHGRPRPTEPMLISLLDALSTDLGAMDTRLGGGRCN